MSQNSRLVQIVSELLMDLKGNARQRDIPLHASLQHLGVDSLGRVELFHRVEKAFNIQFSDQVIAEVVTLQDIENAIKVALPSIKFQSPIHIANAISEATPIDLSSVKSLGEVLALYARLSPERPHIYLQDEEGKELVISYGTLFSKARAIARALEVQSLKPGETVAIMLPTCQDFFYVFFGILLLGCIPVPIYPPLRSHQLEAYAKLEANILNNAEVRVLITFEKAKNLSYLLKAFVPSIKAVVTPEELLQSKEESAHFAPITNDIALIQYTSGSTSSPKGVVLSHHNILSNIRAYGEALQVTPQDKVVSWLPLYHDLGLIGNWLGSLYFGIPLIALTPEAFLNRPEKWLWNIHYHRATISAGPNFAYELCIRKIDPSMIEGLDLSTWRLAINGSETVQPRTLRRFTEKFSPYGFKEKTFLPVYGLAETSLGLTVPPLDRPPRIDTIDRNAFEKENRALAVDKLSQKPPLEFVSCGRPLLGQEIRIVDALNQELKERSVGQLQFRGPSCMWGYHNNQTATEAALREGWWDSGDLAYQAEGEIFITGRQKDLIIKAGRNLHPLEIEDIVASVERIRKGSVIAFGIQDEIQGTDRLVVVAETPEKNTPQREFMVDQIRNNMTLALDVAPDAILLVSPGTIPKTSSGKLMRSACKTMYLENQFDKMPTSARMQLMKLGLKGLVQKTKGRGAYLGKLLYTTYFGILLFGSLFPVLLMIKCVNQTRAAKILKTWTSLLCAFSFCPIEIIGKEKLILQKNPVIFTANHTSYSDVLLLTSLLPIKVVMVGKEALFKIPILKTFLKKAGHISVRNQAFSNILEDTKQVEAVLKKGNSIFIFPEGTFGYAAGLRPFRLGAFKMAVENNLPICPIAIQGTRTILRGNYWLLTPGKIKVTIGGLIYPKETGWPEINRLKNEVRSVIAKHCGELSLDLIISIAAGNKSKDSFNATIF